MMELVMLSSRAGVLAISPLGLYTHFFSQCLNLSIAASPGIENSCCSC